MRCLGHHDFGAKGGSTWDDGFLGEAIFRGDRQVDFDS